ncbi:hypothetical protein [Pseudomonas sp. UBA5706]|uniref:hypothetical protein n=1 Tax=Pseudomonas sp. UBA5706 TaxID=1947321 RepID=UPI000DA629D6
MGIDDLSVFAARDVYLDYDFEEVTFRWDHRARTVHVKFYGADESAELVPADSRLYNDAILYGREISREEYEKGFPRR